jgi:hypothetical protein
MCAFEEEFFFFLNTKKHVIKELFTGRWIVICASHLCYSPVIEMLKGSVYVLQA